ncbi:MAG: hypothetical protein LWW94_10525 [Candidatus Desulfofervidaceae bacterium]|nr:hypothetical protein [Candidatus Desulfofervidaceae bacterium]
MKKKNFLEILQRFHKVNILPWIGSKYDQPDILPYKTLILGESNYTSREGFNPELVIECVKDHIGPNEDPNFSRFATKIRRTIFGWNTTISAEKFWENVAFYNFVQYRVGKRSKERPSEKMWRQSVEAFEEVVITLQPDRILVIGLENWKNLISHLDHENVNNYIAIFKIKNCKFLAGYIAHPSSYGFSYRKWHPIAKDILLKT